MTWPETPVPLRVLHVLPFPGVGGTEIATLRIAQGLAPHGVESSALLLDPDDAQRAWLAEAGLPFRAVARKPEPGLRKLARFFRDSVALARTLRTQRIELLHCADVDAAYFVAVAGRMAGIPVLCHVRNRHDDWTRREQRFIAATHFAFVSAATRTHFARRVPDVRATVVYDGVELPSPEMLASRASAAASVRAEYGLSPDASIAAMFARVNPQKDYLTLVTAAAQLRDRCPRLRILVVGDNDRVPENRAHMRELQAWLTQAGVGDRFVFTGFRTDVRRLMLAADICVLSTHFEGMPLVLIEAMALGIPCVATAVDGVPEVISDGVTGLTYAHQDATGLSDALERLIASPDLAHRIGQAGRAEAERRFGRARFERDMLALYRRLGTGLPGPTFEAASGGTSTAASAAA